MNETNIDIDPELCAPHVHLNGTGKDSLMREVNEAIDALQTAEDVVGNMTVHSRDYYIFPNGLEYIWPLAWTQACERSRKLKKLREELENYRLMIAVQ